MNDRSADPIEHFRVADLDPMDKVSPNFRAYELTVSDLAMRRGIDNGFDSDEHLRNAVFLARTVLQPIREAYDRGFTPNSVFRSQALERTLKNRPSTWISNSQHTRGCACDIEISGVPTLDLAKKAAQLLKGRFDQIICECYDPRKGPNSGWVHISALADDAARDNRGELLSYIWDAGAGGMVYVNGLRASVA